ncbi:MULTISPECIES: AraC family transcriptional regulator [Microbulbifer]|nr:MULTISPECIES: AraC family transcriptional regulator [Microbulbifer]KUJ83819.1 AraC family transcriptional regulator [Microbulbifer sp. ZGT114]
MCRCIQILLVSLVAAMSATAQAQSEFSAGELETLKTQVLKLNRDLLILEEDLLYPAQSQVAIYVSMDVGNYFQLDAVKLLIDEQLTASHLYTEHQRDALIRGGIQPLYKGNLKAGNYEFSAFFTGIGPQGREYKRAASLELEKTDEPLVLELRIADSVGKQQPEFELVPWPAP